MLDEWKARELHATFEAACRLVINHCPNEYAKAYAGAGLKMKINQPDAIRVQCLYILNNISHWRGIYAGITRKTLKSIAEVLA